MKLGHQQARRGDRVLSHPPAKVLWTKESYIKEFLKQTSDTLADGSYDVSKIEPVLDVLIAECTAIAVDQWDPVDVELRARLARARIARLTRGGQMRRIVMPLVEGSR